MGCWGKMLLVNIYMRDGCACRLFLQHVTSKFDLMSEDLGYNWYGNTGGNRLHMVDMTLVCALIAHVSASCSFVLSSVLCWCFLF